MVKKVIIAVIFVLITGIIFYPSKVNGAPAKCTDIRTYYYMAAQIAGSSGNFTEDADTTFIAPDRKKILDIEILNSTTSITPKKYEAYIKTVAERKASELGDNEPYCNDEVCLNSGKKGAKFIDVTDQNVKEVGGYATFINKYIVDENYDADLEFKGISDEGAVVTVKRNWSGSNKSGFEFDGTEYLFYPLVVKVKLTYECEIDEPPGSSELNEFSVDCDGGKGKSVIPKELSTSYTVDFSNEENELLCGDIKPKRTVSANVVFNQIGTLNSYTTEEQYAGGGLSINFDYTNTAWWNYSKNSAKAECKTVEKVPKCKNADEWDDCDYYEVTTDRYGNEYRDYYYDLIYDDYGNVIDREYYCVCKNVVSKKRDGSCPTGYEEDKSSGKCINEDTEKLLCKNNEESGCLGTKSKTNAEAIKEAEDKIKEIATSMYKASNENIGSIYSRDSDNASDTNTYDIINRFNNAGNLDISIDETIEQWKPGIENAKSFEISYIANKACINRFDASIRYTSEDECNSDEIDGDDLYYVPIRLNDNTNFSVNYRIGNVSALKDINWNVNYSCNALCEQELDKYVYRPISLLNPFPDRKNNIGNNWIDFKNDSVAYNAKMNRDKNKIEYSIKLTPDDITRIKQYNQSGYKYTDMKSLSSNGTSKLLKDWFGITNKKGANNYNKLGECTDECW